MFAKTPKLVTAGVVSVSLVLAACGGGDDDSADEPADEPTEEPAEEPAEETTTTMAEETTTTEAAPAVDPLENVRASTVKIEAVGTFVDPNEGAQFNSAGVGTGFIIDETGIVVTNNHVVTGAATIAVYLDGESDPVNAQVLGVSECSDLAVIDLDGDGYSSLVFGDPAEVTEGLDVYAAGFPVVDAASIETVDYTLTRGIVSNTSTPGESSWASVDEVLEHDARIRGGNSGGPLVDTAGAVVGVNFAGIDESDQNFAIGLEEAIPVIEQLRNGEDVDSLGINGQALYDPVLDATGIWVASVETGSPAGEAGIQGGDLITTMENLVLATDGTMSDYCDILRTRGPDAAYAVQVVRASTGEVLEGVINGSPLEPSFSFAQEAEVEVDEGASPSETYTEYVSITDDSGAITVDVPVEWSDVRGEPGEFGPQLLASTDVDAFFAGFSTAGVWIDGSADLEASQIGELLDNTDYSASCTFDSRNDYSDPLYTGQYDIWTDCGPDGTVAFAVVVAPEDGSFLVRVIALVAEDKDLDALDQILNTFVAAF